MAHSSLEYGIAAYRTGNISLGLPIAVAMSAYAFARLGKASEAQPRLLGGEQLIERAVASGLGLSAGYRWLARAAMLLGRPDDVRRLGDHALQVKPGTAAAAHVQHLLGDIATYLDPFDAERGEVHYRQALTLAQPRGMRPLVAHCHFGLGKLYRRTGKRQEAEQHLTTATAMYREMDMRFWLAQAETEIGELA